MFFLKNARLTWVQDDRIRRANVSSFVELNSFQIFVLSVAAVYIRILPFCSSVRTTDLQIEHSNVFKVVRQTLEVKSLDLLIFVMAVLSSVVFHL